MRLKTMVFLVALLPLIVQAQAQTQYQQEQQTADAYYEKGEFGQANKIYLKLAKRGDSFSQYRVSFMYLEGQGRKADVVESFAWAVLAAEDGQKELVKYRNAVADLVPENKRGKAERKADYYTRRWGNLALADNATRRARKQLRECTGSRLGTRCEEVYAMEMPKFWGIDPGHGGGAGGDGGSAAASGSVSSAYGNGAGGATRDVAYYQELRANIRAMDQFIQENSGKVELGEFEVLEPGETSAEEPQDKG